MTFCTLQMYNKYNNIFKNVKRLNINYEYEIDALMK
jgi:hypothetical protein